MSDFSECFFKNGAVFNNNGTFLAQANFPAALMFSLTTGVEALSITTVPLPVIPARRSFPIGLSLSTTLELLTCRPARSPLQAGDGGSTTGSFNISSGATLQFFTNSFNLSVSATISGAGTAEFSSGAVVNILSSSVSYLLIDNSSTVNFNSATTATTISIDNSGTANFNGANTSATTISIASFGTLAGSGTVTSSGLLTLSYGGMSGTGVTNANGGLLIDNADAYLNARTLNNAVGSSATISNFTRVFFTNGAVFNNNGTLLAQSNSGSDGFFDNGGGGTFNNNGHFTRNTGATLFPIGGPFQQLWDC